MKKALLIGLGLLILLLQACQDPNTTVSPSSTHSSTSQNNKQATSGESVKIFNLTSNTSNGISFSNTITETQAMNSLTFEGMLQGAGVGVLDINNDGLQDIYFAANMSSDKLYLNKGNLKFEDVTTASGITAQNWSTGVAVVDINGDGYDDIYVCKFMYDDPSRRHNVFYINNKNGTFTDRAKEMGLDDSGYSIMANFFDYDRDGDLDVYIANQPPNSIEGKKQIKQKVDYTFTDKLYRNDGGKFTDVTQAAGITNYTYSLSATNIDFNKDGWPDIYIACDYDEADLFLKNNGNGTFSNVSHSALKHMSTFSMGVDIADINNDGHMDIYVADMVAEDNFRQKTNMSGMNPEKFHKLAAAGFHYQYMFNALQLNNGDNSFSEIAQLSGVSNTDWSWSPLFMDLDLDGNRDLVVTNGLVKEVRNKDYEKWRSKFLKQKKAEAAQTGGKISLDPMEIVNEAPSFKISNYVYRNKGDLQFQKMNQQWGFEKKSWSQGAAYADFDQDGDLDLIINNMNMQADLYQNMSVDNGLNNYLNIELEGSANNKDAFNASIEINAGGKKYYSEYTPYRGYMSCSQKISNFGLGSATIVDSIKVKWSDDKMTVLSGVKANQTIVVKYKAANDKAMRGLVGSQSFKPLAGLTIKHQENKFDDYKSQILLPYRTSSLGPVIAKGDVNGNGREDLFVGSSTGQAAKLLYNAGDGGFKIANEFLKNENQYEDGGAAFFDVDGDGDKDLFVSSGGSEYSKGSANYADRLYLNNGSGVYTKDNSFKSTRTSSSVVQPLDYDGDGDLDVFVGGRQVPGEYGKPTDSQLYENQNGKLVEVTEKVAGKLIGLGMVTSAQLADVTGNGKPDLVIAGEWMGIKVFQLGSELKDISSSVGLDNTKGWWNTLSAADVDGDGDLDLIGGNLGHNIKYKASVAEPFKLYVDDFDKNGTNDVYLGYYEDGQCYPVRGKQCSTEQMPFVSEKFPKYKDFGIATIDKVLESHISSTTTVQEAQTFANTLFRNNNGKFTAEELPSEAQMSPIYGVAIDDFDGDGKKEVFVAGNMYQREVETTRSDAGKGSLLSFEGDKILLHRTIDTGISADKDVRAATTIQSGDTKYLVIANNNDLMQVYSY